MYSKPYTNYTLYAIHGVQYLIPKQVTTTNDDNSVILSNIARRERLEVYSAYRMFPLRSLRI